MPLTRLISRPSFPLQQFCPFSNFNNSSKDNSRLSCELQIYDCSPCLISLTVSGFGAYELSRCWARQIAPWASEQSTTFPRPVFSLSARAASVPVMPSEAETKSAIQLVGNWYYPGLFRRGRMPLIEMQFRSWPGRRARGPLCPQPLTLRRMTLLLILCRSAGPSLSLSKTPGLKGSITISAWLIIFLTSQRCSLFLRLTDTHFLFLFKMFMLIGMAVVEGSSRARSVTCAP